MANVTSYDELPYPLFIHPNTDPNQIGAVASLMGLRPANPHRCRVLEIACGPAANLISLATLYPEAEFAGLDLSATQIQRGQETIDQLQLTNVSLTQMSIADYQCESERFDYIIAHGIYSWVPNELSEQVLQICRQGLAPHGVAFISYNTYPGWHSKRMIREMIQHQARNVSAPLRKLQQGIEFLKLLSHGVPESTAYGKTLREELANLEAGHAHYLVHEYFAEVNLPRYFHEFLAETDSAGLRFLGEASLTNLQLQTLPAEISRQLHQLPPREREQQIDFFRRRTFRQSVLCRDDVSQKPDWVWGLPSAAAMDDLAVASDATCEVNPGDADEQMRQMFVHELVRFRSTDVLAANIRTNATKIAMLLLTRRWPQFASFSDLVDDVVGVLNSYQAADVEIDRDQVATHLRGELLDLAIAGLVHVRMVAPEFVDQVSNKPIAHPLTRLRAEAGDEVPNRKHQAVRLDHATKLLVQLADGQHNHDDLEEALVHFISGENVTMQEGGQSVEDPAEIRRLVKSKLPANLQSLAAMGLLIG